MKEKIRREVSISLVPHTDDVPKSDIFEIKEKLQQFLDELGVNYIFRKDSKGYKFILKNNIRETVFHSLLTTIRAVTLGCKIEAIISCVDEK